MPKLNLEFRSPEPIDYSTFQTVCRKCLSSVPKSTFTESNGCFIVKQKTDLLNGTYGVTAEISFSNNIITIHAKCMGLGPIQSKHVKEMTDVIKNLITRGIQEMDSPLFEMDSFTTVRCPKCGSSQINMQKRGWTLTTGLIASGKNERVCMNCLFKF